MAGKGIDARHANTCQPCPSPAEAADTIRDPRWQRPDLTWPGALRGAGRRTHLGSHAPCRRSAGTSVFGTRQRDGRCVRRGRSGRARRYGRPPGTRRAARSGTRLVHGRAVCLPGAGCPAVRPSGTRSPPPRPLPAVRGAVPRRGRAGRPGLAIGRMPRRSPGVALIPGALCHQAPQFVGADGLPACDLSLCGTDLVNCARRGQQIEGLF